jgi:hypothetical protein
MKDPNVVRTAWVSPELTVYGKVEEITQQTWKKPGVGDGVIICISNNAVAVQSCAPNTC